MLCVRVCRVTVLMCTRVCMCGVFMIDVCGLDVYAMHLHVFTCLLCAFVYVLTCVCVCVCVCVYVYYFVVVGHGHPLLQWIAPQIICLFILRLDSISTSCRVSWRSYGMVSTPGLGHTKGLDTSYTLCLRNP